jgi:hypothetical protein
MLKISPLERTSKKKPSIQFLILDKTGISPLLGQEFLMLSFLENESVFHHEDDVSILDGGQAMCDHNTCTTLPRIIQSSLDQLGTNEKEKNEKDNNNNNKNNNNKNKEEKENE